MLRAVLRQWFLLLVALALVAAALASLWQYTSASLVESRRYDSIWGDRFHSFFGQKTKFNSTPQKRYRVVIGSTFGYHHDVYMALAWTFKRVLQTSRGTIEVYAPTPFFFGFGRIVEELGLYDGIIQNPDNLIRDLTSNTGDGGIDMVILGTCEIE
jgi:hypothetical protein